MKTKGQKFSRPTYAEDANKAKEFLHGFTDASIMDPDSRHGRHKYMNYLQQVVNGQTKRVNVLIEDLQHFFNDELKFVDSIVENTMSYQRLFMEIADGIIATLPKDFQDEDDFEDLVNQQRLTNVEAADVTDTRKKLPGELTRKYQLYFIRGGQTKDEVKSIRDLSSNLIGSLVSVRAIVIRTTDVKPLITVACYSCDACGYENYQTVYGKQFTPFMDCQSDKCVQNKVRGRLIFNHASSKFIPQQELKIQELTQQLPKGAIPRAFTVYARGETNIRQCSPGDIIQIQGVFLPGQRDGYMANNSLMFSTYIEAYSIVREKKKYAELDMEGQLGLEVLQASQDMPFAELYKRLAASIAPEIYGQLDVKKALLLMMVSGVTKEMHDGMRIRGDINIALIGDPGVAKSQLLRYIAQSSPRGIYTTGKGSSSVGLTAAIIRDQVTNEMTLEGGALVMADMGVCCIDEFDKMNESDRTAIHEVMEQQTVSIAKAGITTTLNARTSILAAANPLYGRYNKKMTPHKNINLPAALLSRFDLIFILLDSPNEESDRMLAKHIGHVHRNGYAPKTLDFEPFDINFLKTFIARAKTYEPIVTESVHKFIADKYVEKRNGQNVQNKEGYSYTTPRTLLAIIRLSQAIAKLRFKDKVCQEDIDEAIRLMDESQNSVQLAMGEDVEAGKQKKDASAEIFEIIKSLCKQRASKTVEIDKIERKLMVLGHTRQQLDDCIKVYNAINVLMVQDDKIILVS